MAKNKSGKQSVHCRTVHACNSTHYLSMIVMRLVARLFRRLWLTASFINEIMKYCFYTERGLFMPAVLGRGVPSVPPQSGQHVSAVICYGEHVTSSNGSPRIPNMHEKNFLLFTSNRKRLFFARF
jgi:hypothetical protein